MWGHVRSMDCLLRDIGIGVAASVSFCCDIMGPPKHPACIPPT